MRRLTGLILCAAAAFTAGCGSPAFAPQGAGNGSSPLFTASAKSWVAPQAKSSDLVYVSDESGRVDMLSYPDGTLVGKLGGLSPAGLCSDKAGHVFVPDTITSEILEYAHGGKRPIATLLDFGYYPQSCAVDPTTGNLAVTNYSNLSQNPGELAIYARATGSPTTYTDPAFGFYFFCSYDDKGNLYVDGVNGASTQTEFAELPNGGSSLTDITIDHSIGYPGAVQWDGKYLAFEDTSSDVVYRLKIKGKKAHVAQTIHFKGQHGDLLAQFWINGSTIMMPYGNRYRQTRNVGFWPYPAGGSATKTLRISNATQLFGVTFSSAKK